MAAIHAESSGRSPWFSPFLVLVCASVSAQEIHKPIPITELVASRSLIDGEASLSPGGEWLAYTVQDPLTLLTFDYERQRTGTDIDHAGQVGSDIWITDTSTGDAKNLTGGIGANWRPTWSPNGTLLVFYSNRDGQPNLWVYDTKSAKLRLLSSAIVRPFGRQRIQWTPDERRIVARIAPNEIGPVTNVTMSFSAGGADNDTAAPRSTVRVYQYVPRSIARDGGDAFGSAVTKIGGLTADEADLALIDVDTGLVNRIVRRLRPAWYALSPDGSQIAFTSSKGLVDGNWHRSLVDLDLASLEGHVRVISADIPRRAGDFDASWSPDGKWLSYLATSRELEGECFLVSATGGSPRVVASSHHPAFNNYNLKAPIWDASGANLYFLASLDALWKISIADGAVRKIAQVPNDRLYSIVGPDTGGRFWSPDGGRSMLVQVGDENTKQSGFDRIDLITGQSQELLREGRFYSLRSPTLYSATAESVVYQAEDAGHGPDFWIATADFKKRRQLTFINSELNQYAMGQSRLVEWKSVDGKDLKGALLLPADYREGTRYPLIVKVYGGGGLSNNLNCFGLNAESNYAPDNLQLFATRGYAVLTPDAPLELGRPLEGLAGTVLPAINKLIEFGIADANRVGVMGASYGGYSVLALLVQTGRFKAAVMIGGFGDLAGMSGEMNQDGSSLGEIIEDPILGGRMPGAPWTARDLYVDNSPIYFLDRMQTPLLIMHGADDRNVAPFLSDQVFTFLRRLRKEVVYAKYAGEGHEISSYDNQIDLCTRMIQWFDEHLMFETERRRKSE